MKGDDRERMLAERDRNEAWAIFMAYRDQVEQLLGVGQAGWDDEDLAIAYYALELVYAELAHKAAEVAALEHGG
jgi:hypothetical protein